MLWWLSSARNKLQQTAAIAAILVQMMVLLICFMSQGQSKIAVEIVVDFHAARLNGAAHGHRAAATEDIDETAVVIRRHLVDDPQQLALATHPRNKAIQGTSPPSSGRES